MSLETIQKELGYTKHAISECLRYFVPSRKKLKKHLHKNYPIVLAKNKKQLTQNFSMMKRAHVFLKKYALCLNIIYQELRLLC